MILTSLFKNNKVIKSSLSDDEIHELKENILIVGPPGTGKTEIIKRISKNYNLPVVTTDSESLFDAECSDKKVKDLLRNLYISAEGDLKEAQKGLLVIGGFDKFTRKNNQAIYSINNIPNTLLKILDGSKMYFDEWGYLFLMMKGL